MTAHSPAAGQRIQAWPAQPHNDIEAPFIDTERAGRDEISSDALWHNPDERFPSLDAVLPLPKDGLRDHVPDFTGMPKDLVNAAKAVAPPPPQPQASPVKLKCQRVRRRTLRGASGQLGVGSS